MGASNVLAAFAMWAGKVPPTSMQLLAYMATVSRDEDRNPWFGMGHEALAEHALGRPSPISEADLKAVERAMTPLHKAGALTTERRGSVRRDGPSTARYRLNLSPVHTRRISGGVNGHKPVDNGSQTGIQDSHDPPETVPDTPRNPSSHPPKSVLTPPEIRGAEEPRGTTRSEKTKEETTDLHTAVTVSRARDRDEDPESPTPRCLDHPAMPAGVRSDGTYACRVCHNQGRRPPPAAVGRARVPKHLRLDPTPTPAPEPPPRPGPADTDQVWITIRRRGITAHRPDGDQFTACQRSMRTGETLLAALVEDLNVTWCPRCWPNPPEAP